MEAEEAVTAADDAALEKAAQAAPVVEEAAPVVE